MELNPKSVEEIIAEMFNSGHDNWLYLEYLTSYIKKIDIKNVVVARDSYVSESALYSVHAGGYCLAHSLEYSSAMQLAKEIVMRL